MIRNQAEPYAIQKKLGEGRYAKSFLAIDQNGEKVVLKNFKRKIFERNISKNYYEAVILSQLCHPSIPNLLGVINQKGFYAYVLEYKYGFTLEEILFQKKISLTHEDILNIFTQLLDITEYLHRNNVVHRDIRISNIIINEGNVALIDFGLARWAEYDKYPFDVDFSYLGDILLFLLYSRFNGKIKKLAWYAELDLTYPQEYFIRSMLRLEVPFRNIEEVKVAFTHAFAL